MRDPIYAAPIILAFVALGLLIGGAEPAWWIVLLGGAAIATVAGLVRGRAPE